MKVFSFLLFFLALTSDILQSEIACARETSTEMEGSEGLANITELKKQPLGWAALPRSRPFPSLLSDPRDLRLGLRKNNKGELEADVGGYRSLAGWRGEIKEEETFFHAGIEGNAYFVMHQEGAKFPLHSSDGLIGLFAEAARSSWQYQLRFTHISAHLSDGLTSMRPRIEYTREFLALRVAKVWGFWRPYLGYQALVHSVPELPRHSLQFGGYGVLPWSWGIARPYLGGDLRIRNAREGTTFQLASGAAFVSKTGTLPVLLTVSYLKGHDLRGQFFEEKTEKWTFGLDLTI